MKFNDNERKYIIEILETIAFNLFQLNGLTYPVYIEKENLSISTKDYILTFDENKFKFFISFVLGIAGNETAEHMKIILTYLDPEEIEILEDCYYDIDNDCILFGKAASDRKYEVTLAKFGSKKCIICDNILLEKYINNDTGVCKNCEENYDELNWC